MNASIVENQALNATAAGGVLARGGSTLVMDRVSGVGCNPDGRCSELSRNSGSGAAALAALGATVTLRRTFVEDNVSTAPSVLRLTDSSTALLEGVVFATNEWEPLSSDAAGIEITGSASATVAYLTSWGNMQFDQTLFSAGSDTEPLGLTLLSSVIDDPFGSALLGAHDPDTSSVFLDCVMLRDDDDSVTPYATSTVLLDEPARLVSPETGDFHLGPDSPAIDFCDIFYYLPSGGDIDGEPRGTDIPEVPNGVGNGTYDLGADEVLPGSEIFADGFESGDTSAWSAMVGG